MRPRASVSIDARVMVEGGLSHEVRNRIRLAGDGCRFGLALGPGSHLADVVLGLETRFGIDIDDAEAATWEMVGDVVGFVALRARGPSA